MTNPFRRSLIIACSLLLLPAILPVGAVAQEPDTTVQSVPPPESVTSNEKEKDVPYVPTVKPVVRQMLETANVTEDDVVYDLGSGDGRIPIMAAKEFGARGVGIEIDPALVEKARKKAKAAGVADKVEFRQMDFFDVDLTDATVVTLYLWPEINVKLRPKLLKDLDPGDRIVSHDFRMGHWEPEQTVDAGEGNTGRETVYLWTVPEEVPEDLLDISDEQLNE